MGCSPRKKTHGAKRSSEALVCNSLSVRCQAQRGDLDEEISDKTEYGGGGRQILEPKEDIQACANE